MVEAAMVVCIPGNRLVGLALIENAGNALTVKVAALDVCAAHGAAPVTIARYWDPFIVTGGAVMVSVAVVAPL